MLDNIKKVAKFVSENIKESRKTKLDKFKEFHKFHKWLLENIDKNIWKEIGNINGICKDAGGYTTSHGLIISIADYKWWAEWFTKEPQIEFIPIKEIQKKTFNRILEVSLNSNMLKKESLEDTLKMIDDTFIMEK